MKKLTLLYFLLSTVPIFSQELFFVNAPNGLIIREKPNQTSERIGKLEYGAKVYITHETDVELKIIDNGKTVSGHWTEIEEFKNKQKGFVFNGYLDSKVVNKGKETENFYITTIHPVALKNYWYNLSNSIKTESTTIYLRNKKHEDMDKFVISDFEFYEGTSLFERDVKNLLNVTEIIIVKNNYNSCCSNHYSNFFLYTVSGELIKLPEFENMHCDGPEPYKTYLFPEDVEGQENKILFVNIIPKTKEQPEKTEILKKYSWNGIKVSEE